MASSSNSSVQNSFKYDVFLSFRGEDTRKNFVDHLYQALKDKGIRTYKDDENIQKGKRISDDLFKSIEDSKFYIIVFSKNYASSSWCLEELVKIMECQKMSSSHHTAYPVFYDVEPTEVRNQSGAVRKAFFNNKNKEAAKKWKKGLKEAADLAGWELKNTLDGHEAKFINKIVQEISLELRSVNCGFDEKLVGMETRVKDVVSCLKVCIDEVRMIGVKGMGGAGKTTTARAVFDHLSNDFEANIFVGNVREVSKASMFGLKNLQEQVLSNVLNQPVTLNSIDDGKIMMKKWMCGKKILLVLDDVDHIDQLEALASEPKWFKPGSRILITTRDEQVLVAQRVNLIRDIDLLSDKEAVCLFSRYAFGRDIPSQEYEELSRKVVRYAAGLPLTIKVLGSFLCGKNKDEWVDAIERLKRIPLKDTLEKLELSYTSLEDEYKEIFLDIACILKGKRKDKAITILESCGFYARNGLKVLEQRSLITYDEDGFLGMHDHIDEMGKNIVRRLHPDEPNKHSHLWIDEEIEDILADDMGSDATRCLKVDMSIGNPRIVMKGLGKMKKLRYLEVNYIDSKSDSRRYGKSLGSEDYDSESDSTRYGECLGSEDYDSESDSTHYGECLGSEDFDSESDSKRYGECHGSEYYDSESDSKCYGECLGSEDYDFESDNEHDGECLGSEDYDFEFDNERDGDLGSEDYDFESDNERDGECLGSEDYDFESDFEVKGESLIDSIFDDTSQLDESTQYFPNSLKYLECWNYPFLYLPESFQANNLVGLEMGSCKRMVQLWEEGEKKVLKKLKFIYLDQSDLTTFDFRITPNLEMLSLYDSYYLAKLCMPVSCQKLKYVHVSHSKLITFDLGLTPNLETLSLDNCTHFVKLHVSVPCPNLKFLDLRNTRLRGLDLELIPKLERLDLEYSDELVKINAPVGCLKEVVKINLTDCLRFPYFGFSIRSEPEVSWPLASLYLDGCSLESCPLHLYNNLPKFRFRCYYDENLSSSVGNIEKLISFGLCACTDIKKILDIICSLQCLKKLKLVWDIQEFPKDLGQLECLEKLHLSSTKIKHLPDSICTLKHLKSLKIDDGDLFEKLPESLGKLECLEMLDVTSKKIEYLPDSICMLKNLKCLNVTECCCLGKLPEDIGQLELLEELLLSSTKIKHLPDCICMLKHLKYLHLEDCALLEKLPEDLGRLECLQVLSITDTSISHLPQSIFGLKGLLIAASSELLQLYDFPSEIETTTSYHQWLEECTRMGKIRGKMKKEEKTEEDWGRW